MKISTFQLALSSAIEAAIGTVQVFWVWLVAMVLKPQGELVFSKMLGTNPTSHYVLQIRRLPSRAYVVGITHCQQPSVFRPTRAGATYGSVHQAISAVNAYCRLYAEAEAHDPDEYVDYPSDEDLSALQAV